MKGPRNIPSINDAATKEELEQMYHALMVQKSDMDTDHDDFPTKQVSSFRNKKFFKIFSKTRKSI